MKARKSVGLLWTRLLPLVAGSVAIAAAKPACAHGGSTPVAPPANWAHGQSHGGGTVSPSLSVSQSAPFVSVSPTAAAHQAFVTSPTMPPLHLPAQGTDLDLSSTTANIVLGAGLFHGRSQVTITVGGQPVSFKSGQQATAAQYVAIAEVLGTGRQTISLDSAGAANGGSFVLNQLITAKVDGLIIPQNVTAYDNVSTGKSINLVGDLTNYGSIYAVSANPHTTAALFTAEEITNAGGAVITTVLPSALRANIHNVDPSVDLSLAALDGFNNDGTISSSGGLTVSTAQGGIVNGHSASMTAINNINLVAGSGALTNHGAVTSSNGNINISTAAPSAKSSLTPATNLDIEANGGRFNATSGNININEASYSGSNIITLNSGDYFSQQLNINAGSGGINGSVGQVSGWINVNAGSALFGAATPNLKLGDMHVTGDPTYFNTAGSLMLSTVSNTNGADLALIASGDVIVSGGTIDTTIASGGNGGNLTIIAGANVVSSGSPGGTSGSNDTTTILTITQSANPGNGSATGGAIDLSGVTAINTNGTITSMQAGGTYAAGTNGGVGGNGGNVLMVAYAGTGAGNGLTSGSINLGTTGLINTAAGGSGTTGSNGIDGGNTNGNVTLIAGAKTDPSGSLPAINIPVIYSGVSPTNSQSGIAGGSINIWTATPTLSSAMTIQDGTIQSGSGSFSAGTTQSTSIAIGEMGGPTSFNPEPTIAAWQSAAASYAIAQINAFRSGGTAGITPSPLLLTESQTLDYVATDEAEYLAATSHYAHFNLQGADPGIRIFALGSFSGGGGWAENIGYEAGANTTAASAFNAINAEMEAEPHTTGTHWYNLTHNNYIGVGFANAGGAYYVVEDFTTAALTPVTPTAPAVWGGIGGLSGILSQTTSGNNTSIAAIGGNSLLPTSINANGANVSITAGGKVTVQGAILTNGIGGLQQFISDPGANGGNVTITAGGNISVLAGIQASGGAGGSNFFNTGFQLAGGTGGNGGIITLTSSGGNITVDPNISNASYLAIGAAGGAGGQAANLGAAGGSGGNGGTLIVSAPAGTITLGAVEVSGGGGAGGAGSDISTASGHLGGAGGNGGAGGTITLTGQNVVISSYLSASGGGGGGAGGQDASANAGGGGGGGSWGESGFGGVAGSASAGGGGGGGAEVAEFGGASPYTGAAEISSSNGTLNGGSGGGAAGTNFGAGGAGGTGTDRGGAGGNLGQAGAADSKGLVTAGAAGAGGTISIQTQTLAVNGTANTFWTPSPGFGTFNGSTVTFATATVLHGGDSMIALGAGGSITVSTVSSASLQYSSDANYTNTAINNPVTVSSGPFTVGTVGSNATLGSIEANTISLNGTQLSSSVSSGSYGGSGSGSVSISIGGTPTVFTTGDMATSSEIIAIIQVETTGTQSLQLSASGAASTGSFTFGTANLPSGGFTTPLNLPSSTTANDAVSNLSFPGATINGTLQVVSNSGTAILSLSQPTLNVNGSILNASGSLNIQGTGTNNAIDLVFGAGGMISTTSAAIAFNGTSPGTVTVTGSGSISAAAGNGAISFNGGNGVGSQSVNVNVPSLAGIVSATGATIVLTSTGAGSGITTGIVTSDGTLTVTANGPIATTGATTASSGNVTLQATTGSGGGVALGGSIVCSGTTLIQADNTGAGGITQTAGTVGGSTVNLVAGSGGVGSSSAAIDTAATNTLTAQSVGGDVYMVQTGAVALGASSAGLSNNLSLIASGPITVNGTVAAGNNVTLMTTTGSGAGIAMGANITAGFTAVLQADGAGNITSTAGAVSGDIVNLATGSGSIGTSTNQIHIDTTVTGVTLTATTSSSGAGNIYINQTGSNFVHLDQSNAGLTGTFQLTAQGPVTTLGAVSGQNVTLQTASGSGQSITLGGNITAGSTAQIQVDNTGSTGSIQQSSGWLITAGTVNLIGGGGDVGGNGTPIATAATTITSTNTGGGSVYISQTGAVALTGSGVSAASSTANFQLTATGTITANAVSGQNVTLQGVAGNNVSVIANGNIGSGGGTVILTATGTGTITQAGGVSLKASTLTLTSGSGDIGQSGQYIQTNAGTLSAASGGYLYLNDTNGGATSLLSSTAANDFDLTSSGNLTASGSIFAGGAVSVQATSGLTVQNVTSAGAGMSLVSNGGTLGVAANAQLTSSNGAMIINNLNASSALITIGSGVTMIGSAPTSPANDQEVVIAIGTIPNPGTNTTAPTNFASNPTNGGTIYYGPSGTVTGASAVTVNSNTYNVVLNSQNASAGAISFQGSDVITATPPVVITSLDLTNAAATTAIQNLQGQGLVGGNLSANHTVIFSTFDSLSGLTALNIPSGDSVTFQDFHAGNPVTVTLTGASTTTNAQILGTAQFVASSGNPPSSGVITVSSNQTGQVLLVGATGTLKSDGMLNVTVGSSVAGGTATVAGGGTLTATGNLTLATNAGNTSIVLNNSVTSTGGAVTINAGGSGAITQTAGSIIAGTVNLISGGSDIGTSMSPITTLAATVTATTTGSAYITNPTAAVNVGASAVGTLLAVTAPGITSTGAVNANNVTLQALSGSGGSIVLSSTVGNGMGTVTLTPNGIGTITQTVSTTTVNANSLVLTTSGGGIGTAGQSLVVNSSSIVAAAPAADIYISSTNSGVTALGNFTGAETVLLATTGSFNATGTVAGQMLTVNATNSITTSATGMFSSPSLILSAANIGTNLAVANISTPLLNVTATGSAYLNNTGASSISVSSVQVGASGTFSLTSQTAISVFGTITGQNVTLQIANGSTASIDVENNITAGGTLTLGCAGAGSSVTVAAAATVQGNIIDIVNPTGSLTLLGFGTYIAPQQISVSGAGNVNVGGLFSSQVVSTQSIVLTATAGVLTLPVNLLTVTTDGSGDGGSIAVSASSLALGSATQPFVLTANASGTGKGGNVTVNLSGTEPVTVGTGAANIEINATGGSVGASAGDGGNVTLTAGGNLTVNSAQIAAAPLGLGGAGAFITLKAGTAATTTTGLLVIKGGLTANGTGSGIGGDITLQSNSKTAFSVDSSKATNGTQVALSVSGATDGIISVTNLGTGGVTELQSLSSVSQVTLSSVNGPITVSANLGGAGITSTINLTSTGTGKITDGSKDVITANTLNASSGSGAITLPDVAVANVGAATGIKAAVAITNLTSSPINVTSASGLSVTIKSLGNLSTSGLISAGTVTLENTSKLSGDIVVGGAITSSGAVVLSSATNITVSASEVVSGTKAVTVTASGIASVITLDGDINAGATGTIALTASASTSVLPAIDAVSGSDIGGGKSVTLTASKSSVSVDTIGGSGGVPGTVTITALNNITNSGGIIQAATAITEKTTSSTFASVIAVEGNLETNSAATSPTGAIAVTVAGLGGIISATSADIGAAKSVTLTATKGLISIDTIGAAAGSNKTPVTVNLTALNSITNLGTVNATTTVTEKTTSTSATVPSVIDVDANVTASASAGTVTMTNSGAGVTSGIFASDAAVNIGGTKLVTLSASKGAITVGSISAGIVKVTSYDALDQTGLIVGGTSVALATTAPVTAGLGSITVNSISTGTAVPANAGGAISVIASSGILQVDGTAVISANSGKTTKATVTLENKLITGAAPGSIVIDAGATIETGGTLGSTVNIAMGAPPGSPKFGSVPAGAATYSTPPMSGGPFFFGTASSGTGTITISNPTADPTLVSINSVNGGKVVFNTGALPPSAITINGATGLVTTITADPPSVFAPGLASAPSSYQLPVSAFSSQLLSGAATSNGQNYSFGTGATPSLSANSGSALSPISAFSPASAFSVGSPDLHFETDGLAGVSDTSVTSTYNSAAQAVSYPLSGAVSTSRLLEPIWISDTEISSGHIPAAVVSDRDFGIKTDVSTVVDFDKSSMTLKRGSVLFAPCAQTVVSTPLAKVLIDKDSLVLVIVSSRGVAVFNFDDRHKDAVAISNGDRAISVGPGKSAFVTAAQQAEFEDINPAQMFGYRGLGKANIGGELKAFTSEFCLTSAATQVLPLRQLMASRVPAARRTSNRMIKTAVIVSQISDVTMPFRQVVRPALAASSR